MAAIKRSNWNTRLRPFTLKVQNKHEEKPFRISFIGAFSQTHRVLYFQKLFNYTKHASNRWTETVKQYRLWENKSTGKTQKLLTCGGWRRRFWGSWIRVLVGGGWGLKTDGSSGYGNFRGFLVIWALPGNGFNMRAHMQPIVLKPNITNEGPIIRPKPNN